MAIEKKCEECGKPYQSKPSQAAKRRFCSTHCKMVVQMRAKLATGWKPPNKPRRGTETPCPVCGTMVYANKSQRAKGVGVYCSHACHNAGQTKEKVVKRCERCGAEMALRPCYAEQRFCSKKCEGLSKIKRPLARIHNGKQARLDTSGYVMLWEPTHPNKTLKGWIREHQLVVEAVLGRYLEAGEECHHINGVKDDNRPENLVVLGKHEHGVETAANNWGRLRTARDELEEYRKRFGPLM